MTTKHSLPLISLGVVYHLTSQGTVCVPQFGYSPISEEFQVDFATPNRVNSVTVVGCQLNCDHLPYFIGGQNTSRDTPSPEDRPTTSDPLKPRNWCMGFPGLEDIGQPDSILEPRSVPHEPGCADSAPSPVPCDHNTVTGNNNGACPFPTEENSSTIHSEESGEVKQVVGKADGLLHVKSRDSRKQWGMSIKRGCQARFTVKILLHAPHIAELCVLEDCHVNKDGVVVHGGLKLGDRGAFSAHLSLVIRTFVDDCLRETTVFTKS